MTFDKQTSYLIVGANGVGKSTLVKLLIGLYEPTEGRILINGVDSREYEISSLQKAIGVIFQQFSTFPFSAKENIGIGCVESIEDTYRIKESAKRARANDFLEQLVNGYDTCLSRLYTKGTELSVGQWQRVCLARLFMKDSSVIVFDEPTASLDIETEYHLLREIVNLAENKLCILISHRTVRKGVAEHIIVLDNGTLAEEGTYEQLVNNSGKFAELTNLLQDRPLSRRFDVKDHTPRRSRGLSSSYINAR